MIMIGANEAQWLQPGDHATQGISGALREGARADSQGAAGCVVPRRVADGSGRGRRTTAIQSRPVMPLLVEAQRKAAHAQGCAFYSTYDWMGGKGSAAKWFKKHLVGSDFQHLSRRARTRWPTACSTR